MLHQREVEFSQNIIQRWGTKIHFEGRYQSSESRRRVQRPDSTYRGVAAKIMVPTDTIGEFRPRGSSGSPRVLHKRRQGRRKQRLVALLGQRTEPIRRPRQQVGNVRLRQGGEPNTGHPYARVPGPPRAGLPPKIANQSVDPVILQFDKPPGIQVRESSPSGLSQSVQLGRFQRFPSLDQPQPPRKTSLAF